MDDCLAKACGVDMEATESATLEDEPAENTQDNAPVEGVILAGLQAAQTATAQAFPADAESAVSTEAGLEAVSPGAAAAISCGEGNAVDAPVEAEGRQAAREIFADEQVADAGIPNAAGQDATAPKVQGAPGAPASGREIAATIFADEQVADARIPAGAGQDATAEKVQGAPAFGREVAEKIFADVKNAGVRSNDDARQDAALSLRQFQAADKSGESGFASAADSASSDASDERGAFTGSDAKAVQAQAPPSPAAPAAAGFAVSLAETAQPAHTLAPPMAQPMAPQISFEVGEHAFVLTRKSDTSVEVILSPPGVGRLEIRVALEKGVINANIVAADSIGREAIERSLPNIIQMLADEGIAVGGFNVSLKNGGYGTSETQQAASAPGDDAAFIAAPEAPRIKAKSGLVDIFV